MMGGDGGGGGGWGGDKSTWLLSLLFSLKSCSAAEQKATSRRPPLRVGTAIYFYPGVEAAAAAATAVEAAEARLSPAECLVPTPLPHKKIQETNKKIVCMREKQIHATCAVCT